MDPRQREFTLKDIPEFNDRVCRGLAYAESKDIPKFIERLITICSEFFPPGLSFDRAVRANPIEHFEKVTREYNYRRQADISRSDYYMMKYYFDYEGDQLGPYCMLIPYVSEGGLFTFRDTTYAVSTVMTDIGFSIYPGKIFIPFARTKYNFHKDHHFMLVNHVRKMGDIYYAPIHHEMKGAKKTSKLPSGRPFIFTTLAHYLFARYGFISAVKMFAGVDVIVKRYEESDKVNYPKPDYVAFTSARFAETNHPSAGVTIYVKLDDYIKDEDYINTLCASFYYVFDVFTDEFDDLNDVDVPSFWQQLLGNIIKGDDKSRGAILIDMENHMASTDRQLDDMTRDALKERDVVVNDIYELFHELMTSLKKAYVQTGSEEASVYNKRFTVLPFFLEEINTACTNLAQKLQSEQTHGKQFTKKDINDLLSATFKLNICVNDINRHGEVNPASTPNDNMIHQITSNVIDRENAGGVKANQKKGRVSMISDPKRKLHSSIAEVFQFTNLPKGAGADGRGRINPTVQLSVSGRVKRKEHLRALTDEAQRFISDE